MPDTEEDPVQKQTSKRARQYGKLKVIIQRHVQGHERKTEEGQPYAQGRNRRKLSGTGSWTDKEEAREMEGGVAFHSGTLCTAKAWGLEIISCARNRSGLVERNDRQLEHIGV